MAIKKVWIEEGCIVCNACETTAPEVFIGWDMTVSEPRKLLVGAHGFWTPGKRLPGSQDRNARRYTGIF